MKRRQVTIKDIAKQLGISPATVSRALKDDPRISQATKSKVIALSKALQYEPNKIALGLKKQYTKTIGVIVPEIIHHFFSSVISGIEEIAYAKGYTVMFCQSNESYEKEVIDIKALLSHRVDGFLVSHSRETQNFDHFHEVQSRQIPIVFFDRISDKIKAPKVIIDDFEAARQATQHLIDQSCRSIAHLAGPLNLAISQRRKEGYFSALRNNAIPIAKHLIINCHKGTKEIGYKAMKKLLALPTRPDGVFANNDLVAYGAMVAIKEARLSIPEDVAVVGFSNWDFSSLIEPQLSSVDQQGIEMGRVAVATLFEQIDHGYTPKDIIKTIPTKFIIRGSSER